MPSDHGDQSTKKSKTPFKRCQETFPVNNALKNDKVIGPVSDWAFF